MKTHVAICDCSLRDGSNAVHHSLTPSQVGEISRRLDAAGVYTVEVGHGDGLAASSLHYGQSAFSDEDLIAAAVGAVRRASIAVSIQPGIATMDDMRAAHALGATVFKVATHCTEADIGVQHIALALELGGRACGGLMMSHMADPAALVSSALIMADVGAETIYIADSAGAMTTREMRERIAAVRQALDPAVKVAVHAHNNLSLAVANSVAAVEEGATVVDACLGGFGAGAGNCQLEAVVAVLHRMAVDTGVDLWQAQDAAEECIRPLVLHLPQVDRVTLTLGFAGVYSSFMAHTEEAAERFEVDPRDILVELGRRRVVAGQEDAIIEVAADIQAARHG